MKFGKISFSFLFFITFFISLYAEEKITTVPLVNLENLEASFESEDFEQQDISEKKNLTLKEKNIKKPDSNSTRVNIVALDKITAKTSDINLLLGETKKFGLLEIKALKCGNVESRAEQGQAAYIQVKDLSDNLSNQVFVFNGWTFSSSTTLNPLDHPVYDLWLVSCENV
ncbi:DUF2155 domain-containing protein [Pelagibacteraceae bacterium]|nr:DUF2155 domain-containing protein [Pelagibacteraceae bacterium]|tara:strand:- start:90 stop:599 length:510 start_codon:yes stop_codon:yes gene_type:complete